MSKPTAQSEPSTEVLGRSRRMSVGGKLSFRRRVPEVEREGLPLVDGADDPPHLDDLVPEGFDRVAIEVGPGKGAFLCAAAAAQPDTYFVGIEAAPSYASYTASQVAAEGCHNVTVLIDNAALFLRDRVEAGDVDQIHVLFPDPWPKRRHRTRRFFHDGIDETLHHALRADGLLLVASDNPGYSGQIARVLGASPHFRREVATEDELIARGPGHAFSPTNFERKYLEEGRRIRRFAFRHVIDPEA